MEQFRRMYLVKPLRGAARGKHWIILSVALLALLTLSGTVSAATMSERIKPEPGVLIVAVADETPASEVGLARGDILLAIDGDMVNTAAELRHVILMRDPGDTLELTVKRGDEEMTLTATLADKDGYPLLGVAPNSPNDGRMRVHRMRSSRMRGFARFPAMERGMKDHGLPAVEGVAIMEVLEDSPAAAAGLMAGDLITSVGTTGIEGMKDLVEAAAQLSPGDEVELTVDRDGEIVSLIVTLGAHPDDDTKAFIGARIMATGHFRPDMDGSEHRGPQQWGSRFGFPRGPGFDGRFSFTEVPDGALVMSVQDEGPAGVAALEKGDFITAVGETEIASFNELVETLANYSPGDEVELTIDRQGEAISTILTLGAHPEDETKAYLGVSVMPLDRFRMQLQDKGEQAQKETESSHQSDNDS